KKKEILHITTGLEGGGAEGVLYRLCTNDSINSHTVISLTNTGIYGPRLTEKGINVYVLNMPRGRVTVSGVYTLWKLISSLKPDVVQTWMYHSDLLGGIIAKICGHKNIVWNIRNSTLDAQTSSTATRLVARLCAMLSNFIPTKIACCANEAADIHIA